MNQFTFFNQGTLLRIEKIAIYKNIEKTQITPAEALLA